MPFCAACVHAIRRKRFKQRTIICTRPTADRRPAAIPAVAAVARATHRMGHREAALGLLAVLAFSSAACAQHSTKTTTAAAAAAGDVEVALKKAGFTSFLQLAEVAGLTPTSKDAVLTIMAPTNAAVAAFLKTMNLTAEEMKSRPGLAAAVVAYHVIPRVKGTVATLKEANATKQDPLFAVTADNVHTMRFYLTDKDKGVAADVFNNTANVVQPNVDAGKSIIHGIDRVLRSGDVFVSIAELLALHPEFEEVQRKVIKRTGIEPFKASGRQYTLFLPTDDALVAANKTLTALSKEQLVQVLQYHMLPGAHPLPAGIKPGQLYDTELKGQKLKFEYIQVDVPSTSKNANSSSSSSSKGLDIRIITDTFKGNSSSAPRVDFANVFAQRIVIHGIDKVLIPDLKKAATTAQAAAASAPAATPPKAGAVRALLQVRGSSIRGVSVNGLSVTNTQSAIRAAAEGRSSSADAASSGTFYAHAATARCWNCETTPRP